MDAETFCSAQDFLDNGEKHEPDCLVLDVQMPGISGLELSDRLAQRNSCIPVIFISAHHEEDICESAAVRRAVAFLRKPVTAEMLLGAILDPLKLRGQEPPQS